MPVLTSPALLPMFRQLEEPTTRYTGGGLPKGGVMIVVLAALYVLPSLLAWQTGSPRRGRIIAINILLGWTIIGWIAAMVMLYATAPKD
jgi:hypothetical protein